MSWRAALRFSGPAYAEVAFQAIYGLRQGNLAPSEIAGGLVAHARRRVAQSKLLLSAVLALIGLGSYVALRPTLEALVAPGLTPWLYDTAVLASLLVLELALLWWTGLQILPTFLASGTFTLLATLPLDSRTQRRLAALVFLRLFDAPALACLLVTPIGVAAALGSPLAGVAILPGVALVVVVAMVLALWTAEFFVRRIQGSSAGPAHTILRWTYLLVWALPAFAMYGFLAAAPSYLGFLRSLEGPGISSPILALLGLFPMPFAALPSIVESTVPLTGTSEVYLLLVVAGYLLLAAGAVAWLAAAPLRLARALPLASGTATGRPFCLRTTATGLAIVRKDLQIASRTPGFAFVILLPLLDAVALGLLTFTTRAGPVSALGLAEAAVSTSALLATFFGPALFALEAMGYGYVRALPISGPSMVLGKVTLVVAVYLVSAALVVAFSLARLFAPLTFLEFIAAELPAVAAASILEFSLLFRRSGRGATPVVNLYTGAWWTTIVAVPAVVVAGLPLAVYQALGGSGSALALPLLGLVALVELGVALPLGALTPDRRRA